MDTEMIIISPVFTFQKLNKPLILKHFDWYNVSHQSQQHQSLQLINFNQNKSTSQKNTSINYLRWSLVIKVRREIIFPVIEPEIIQPS